MLPCLRAKVISSFRSFTEKDKQTKANKITNKELQVLIKHFKVLVEADVVGITSSDARETIDTWLRDIGEEDTAEMFSREILNYQLSPKIKKLESQYNNW